MVMIDYKDCVGGVTDLVELVWCFRVWCFYTTVGSEDAWVLVLCFVFCFVLLVEERRETKHTQVNFAEL